MHEKSLAAGAAPRSRLRREAPAAPPLIIAPPTLASAPAALRSLVLPHQLYNRHAATDDINVKNFHGWKFNYSCKGSE